MPSVKTFFPFWYFFGGVLNFLPINLNESERPPLKPGLEKLLFRFKGLVPSLITLEGSH